MSRYRAAAFACLIFVGLASSQNETKAPAIRVNVDLISVSVRVTDKQDHDSPGLTADDFALFEDGRKQKISFFDTETEPIALSIVVDSSSSMNRDEKLDVAQGLLAELIDRSRLQDEISVLQFTDHVVGFRQITREQRLMTLPYGITSESGGTALYDAVASALCHLRTSRNLRQAIVVITDGADQHSRLALEQLIRLVQSSRAQLFVVGFYSQSDYRIYKQSENTVPLVTGQEIGNPLIVFDRLARESGAEAFFPTTKKGLEQAVGEISTILGAQYTLSYYPEGSAKALRHVQIKLNRGGLKFVARQSVSLEDPLAGPVEFDRETCRVSAKAHPYLYESRLTEDGDTFDYHEDFSDPLTGWPNRRGSRYIAGGYELSYQLPKPKNGGLLIDASPVGIGALAAYGPWWDDFRASAYVDAGWAKMRPPTGTPSLKSKDILDVSSAGLVFRLNDSGYYAFLLSTSPQAYKTDQLSFKLVSKTFRGTSEQPIIPWTPLSPEQVQQGMATGIKLTVEGRGDQIVLFVGDQQVGSVSDMTYPSGYIGFVSQGTGRVVFRNLDVRGTR
ncbi:MAG TPA: VWA domain-containing protein [Candidatus Sulfotelmatobacter sp.]